MPTAKYGIATALFSLVLLLTGCGSSAPSPAADAKKAEAVKQYQMKGEIMGLDKDQHVATIKHDRIEGFMEGMTMGYPVKDEAEFGKLAVGDKITATVNVAGDDMWVGNIQKGSGDAGKK